MVFPPPQNSASHSGDAGAGLGTRMRTLRMGTDALRASPPAQQRSFLSRSSSKQVISHASPTRAVELQVHAMRWLLC